MRKRFLVITVAVIGILAVVSAFAVNQFLINQHMYPQDAIHEDSNLAIKGIVISIEQNHESQGMLITSYHTFRLCIQLNITKVMWIADDHTEYLHVSTENNTVMGWDTLYVGYDNLDNPLLVIGQAVECKGYYEPRTDSPYSFKLTVSPSISESYLKQQT